ncbi:MAG: 50S ribosomal protein L9 [Patescibacteria group bacterium]|nr:50S ribosomal protein L9 [Patescibacteria group bacterium]
MKVILLQNMPALGNKGEIKEVSDGYALNFLLPQKKAVLATEQNVQSLQAKENQIEARIEAQSSNYQKIARTLNKQAINFSGKISEKNNLFESISAKDIIKAIKEKFNLDISEKWFSKTVHIKEVGRHVVYLRLPSGELISVFINIKAI